MPDQTTKPDAKTFEFTLSTPIKYTNKDGTFSEASHLVLHSPARGQLKHSRKLRQFLTRSLMEVGKGFAVDVRGKDDAVVEDKAPKSTAKIGEKEISIAIYCQDASVDIFFDHFRRLMCSGSAKLDGLVDMHTGLYDRLTPDDEENLSYKYCAFFLMTSFQ